MEKAVSQPGEFEVPSSLCGLASAILEQARKVYGRCFEPFRQA